MRRTLFSSLLALLVLAACNTTDLYDAPNGTVPITVATSFSTGLDTQGVPYDPETGEPGVTEGLVRVFTETDGCLLDNGVPIAGEEIFFDGDGNITEESDAAPQLLSVDTPTLSLSLPPGSYTFLVEAGVIADGVAQTVFALGLLCEEEITSGEDFLIPLISYVGLPELVAPEEVMPGEVFDVLLDTTFSEGDGPNLRVPASDYFVSYDVESESNDFEIVGESNLGIRLVAGCEEISVTAFVDEGTNDVNFDSPEPVFATIPISPPCAAETAVGVDLIPPSISVEGLAEDGSLFLQIEVSDAQSGIDRVEIYDGPILVEEPELGESDASSAWFLELDLFELSSDQLVVLVYDNADNENRAEVQIPTDGQ